MELLTPQMAKQKLSKDNVMLVDIRGSGEYLAEHIDGAININPDNIKEYHYEDEEVIFYCLSGARTQRFVDKLIALPAKKTFILKDGISGWKMAGYTTVKSRKYRMPFMQQVQLGISLFLLVGLFLTYAVSSWFSLIILFVAIGLIVASITGVCGMAMLLSKMPWNRS